MQAGDSLASIADKHNTTVEELRALNNLTSNFIYVDQVLKVAVQNGAAEAPVETLEETPGGTVIHTVQQGEWIYSIARQYGVSPAAIIQANNLPNVNMAYPGQQLIIP